MEEMDLIKQLGSTDAELINLAFGVSETLGVAAMDNSMQSFQVFLREANPKFIPALSIEWRVYLVKLLLGIDDQYRDVVMARVLITK